MKYLLTLFILFLSVNFINAQNFKSLDSIVNINLPSLSSLSINTSNTSTLLSRKYDPDFSNVKVNMNFREIKEGFFHMSKDAFTNYDQFDYEVFKYTPEDALRRITPNYDLHSAPLPSPTYYQID